MRRFPVVAVAAILMVLAGGAAARGEESPVNQIPAADVQAIEKAAPDAPAAKPAKARKVLVYGRVPTHGDPVKYCFRTMEILGKKSGAFEAVSSGDPTAFLPESLKAFDAVVMNNTHEAAPLLPLNFKDLGADEQAKAKAQESVLKKSLLDFVSGGKGLAGIHGAACSVQWPEYVEMVGGTYATHIAGAGWVRVEDAASPLCTGLPKESIAIDDEMYIFGGPYSRQKLHVLAALDLAKMKDPEKRPDKDYAVSWIRDCGKGRVFYFSLGHAAATYRNPECLKLMLAGVQYAIGDLAADATPSGEKKKD